MLATLTAADAVAHLHAELGAPPLLVLDPPYLALRVRSACATCAPGTLVVLVATTSVEAAELSARLAPHDPQVVETADAWLVLAHIGTPEMPTVAPTTPDALPVPSARPDDLIDARVRAILRHSTARTSAPTVGSTEDQYLGRHGLLALYRGTWRPTLAAMVLAGRRADLHVPGCRLIGDIDGEQLELAGNLPRILQGLDPSVLGNAEPFVVCEGVFNAFIHRDWSDGAPVELGLRGGRLEVANPGRLADAPPNPLLRYFAGLLGMSAGEGTGLGAVAARLRCQRLPRHSLFERDGRVRFVADVGTLPRRTPRDLPRRRRGSQEAEISGGMSALPGPAPQSVPPPDVTVPEPGSEAAPIAEDALGAVHRGADGITAIRSTRAADPLCQRE